MQTKYFRYIARKAWFLVALAGICLVGPTQTVYAQGAAACPPGGECPCTWTKWLDRDDPTGVGDFEDLVNLVPQACKAPLAIQCRYKGDNTTAGWGHQYGSNPPVNTAGAGYTCLVSGPSAGGICTNAKTKPPGTQSKPSCKDSEVRFCCAKEG